VYARGRRTKADRIFQAAKEKRVRFEKNHPTKAKLGWGKVADLRDGENVAKTKFEKADAVFDKTWANTSLRDRAIGQAKEFTKETKSAQNEMDELKPDYDRGCVVLKQERALRLERQREKESKWHLDDKQHELTLERGMSRGFDIDF